MLGKGGWICWLTSAGVDMTCPWDEPNSQALPLRDLFWITKRRADIMALQSGFLGSNPLFASQVDEQNRTLSSHLLLVVLTSYLPALPYLPAQNEHVQVSTDFMQNSKNTHATSNAWKCLFQSGLQV